MRFKANWIFFILFSMKSHKANNLVARKQVPFCSYFLVLSLHALFLWVSLLWWRCLLQSRRQVDNRLPALCLRSPAASDGLFVPCGQGLEVSQRHPEFPPAAGAGERGGGWLVLQVQPGLGSVGHGCPGPGSRGAGWARRLRLFLHLGSALLACRPRLTLALEIETYLKGNSSFRLCNLWKQGNIAVGQSYNSLSPLAWRALLVFTAHLRFY